MNALVGTITAARDSETQFTVPGMHCAGCITKIERGLGALPGVAGARVNFTAKRVRIAHDASIDADALGEAIRRLGFEANLFLGEAAAPSRDESRELVKALAVAGFAAMNVMLLSVSVWSGATGVTRQMFHWLSALIALPAVVYAGRPFFRSAWGALRRGTTNMDVPISIGVVLASALSLFETATGGEHAYFDGVVMLLFFLLAGRYLDSVMRDRANDGIAALLRQTAPRALVVSADGTTRWRDAAELAPGMRILVAAGERLAADGVVEQGDSTIDRALVTGEADPDAVGPGGKVLAGTINLDAPLTIRVTAVGDGTVIADIARMMEAAGASRSLYVRVADRAARLYAPAVHTLAALSFAGWMIAGAGWHQSILIAVAVLIITCPCALGLAVPVAQVVAAGALARSGVLIKDGSALERLAEADAVLIDKTGTLTLGRPLPIGDLPLDADEQQVALALARSSRHPLSRALATQLEAGGISAAALDGLREVPGCGIEGDWQGRRVRLGRPDWVDAAVAAGSNGPVTAFRIDGRSAHLLRFEDRLRPDANAAIASLRALGMAPTILSGDRTETVAAVGGSLDLPWQACCTPAEKYERIGRLAQAGRRVLMIGDGLNDGPALRAAHVSIAPSSASDVGQTAADLIFLGDGLHAVPTAIVAARRTMRIIRQNFALAIGYNVLAVPLAIAGYVTPLVAAASMSASSLLVVANALRLRRATR